jgi:hypothetical protein
VRGQCLANATLGDPGRVSRGIDARQSRHPRAERGGSLSSPWSRSPARRRLHAPLSRPRPVAPDEDSNSPLERAALRDSGL